MKPKVEALLAQIESGQLKTNNAKTLDYIISKPEGATIQDMRMYLGLKHQTLTSRISDLVDMGLIYAAGVSRLESAGKAVSYTVYRYEPNKDAQKARAYEVKRGKYENLKKRLETDFAEFL